MGNLRSPPNAMPLYFCVCSVSGLLKQIDELPWKESSVLSG